MSEKYYTKETGWTETGIKEQERREQRQWCQFAGPERGDCEHFVGIPKSLNYPDDMDEYGIPRGWCVACWRGKQLEQCEQIIASCERCKGLLEK